MKTAIRAKDNAIEFKKAAVQNFKKDMNHKNALVLFLI